MTRRHNELVAENQDLKRALAASDRRGKRAVAQARQLTRLIAGFRARAELWADSLASDDQNAFKVLTVGQCRALVTAMRALDSGAELAESAEPGAQAGDEPAIIAE